MDKAPAPAVALFDLAKADAALQLVLAEVAESCGVELATFLDLACFTVAVLECVERGHYTLYDPQVDASKFNTTREPTLVTTGMEHMLPMLVQPASPDEAAYVHVNYGKGRIPDPGEVDFQVGTSAIRGMGAVD